MRIAHSRNRHISIDIALTLLQVSFCIALISCNASSAPSGSGSLRGRLIAVVGPQASHPRWPGLRGGALRFQERAPHMRLLVTTPADGSAEALLQTARSLLDQRVHAVCMLIDGCEVAAPALDLFEGQQIPVVAIGLDCGRDTLMGVVEADRTGAAELLGANLQKIAGERHSYILVHEDGRDDVSTNCYQRFQAAVQREYDMQLLRQIAAAGSPDGGRGELEQTLRDFRHAGIVVTLNAELWTNAPAGWLLSLRSHNENFRFATTSAAPDLWRYLGTSEQPGPAAALVGPLDGELGLAAVEIASELLLGVERRQSQRRIPCQIVTAENLPDFARRYAEAAGGLDVTEYLPKTPSTAPSGSE